MFQIFEPVLLQGHTLNETSGLFKVWGCFLSGRSIAYCIGQDLMDYQRHIIIVNDTPSQTNIKKDA